MRIVLTQDVSKRKKWLAGMAFDWPRPTISAISTSIGHDDWWEFADKFDRNANLKAMRKPGRPRQDARTV